MTATRSRFVLVVVLAIAMTAGAGGAAEAKKGSGSLDSSKSVNAPIPNATNPPFTTGVLTSTIKAGNKFKGKKIRDVNVTIQIAGTGTNSIQGLSASLRAPNGTGTTLFFPGLGPGNLMGPLTLDDETRIGLEPGTPDDSTGLFTPYQGTAQPQDPPLAVMDGGRVKGDWTLTILDFDTGADTNTLVSWSLKVRAGEPYVTK